MIEHVAAFVLPAAYALLPAAMNTPAASALLLAIGQQESRFLYRHQEHGPARGFWQFEVSGVRGVMEHRATMTVIAGALSALRYDHTAEPSAVHPCLQDNDTLAACFARCLLWTLPAALPERDDPDAGWACYMKAWRPGKAHRESWNVFYTEGWAHVLGRRS